MLVMGETVYFVILAMVIVLGDRRLPRERKGTILKEQLKTGFVRRGREKKVT